MEPTPYIIVDTNPSEITLQSSEDAIAQDELVTANEVLKSMVSSLRQIPPEDYKGRCFTGLSVLKAIAFRRQILGFSILPSAKNQSKYLGVFDD